VSFVAAEKRTLPPVATYLKKVIDESVSGGKTAAK
jgi:hypothetical protein